MGRSSHQQVGTANDATRVRYRYRCYRGPVGTPTLAMSVGSSHIPGIGTYLCPACHDLCPCHRAIHVPVNDAIIKCTSVPILGRTSCQCSLVVTVVTYLALGSLLCRLMLVDVVISRSGNSNGSCPKVALCKKQGPCVHKILSPITS